MALSLNDKNSLQRLAISQLLEELREKKPEKNQAIDNFLLAYLRKIFMYEMEYYGVNWQGVDEEDEILLIFDYDKKAKCHGGFLSAVDVGRGKFVLVKPEIYIHLNNKERIGLFSDDPDERVRNGAGIVQTLFHEIGHFRQFLMIQENRSSKQALRWAKEALYARIINYLYSMNHDRFSMEADAEAYLNEMDLEVINGGEETKRKKTINEAITGTDYIVIPNGKIVDRDTFIDEQLDSIVKHYKMGEGLFVLYPILRKEYNKNRTHKSLSDIMGGYFAEIKRAKAIIDKKEREIIIRDIKEMYFDIFNRYVSKDNRFELLEAVRIHGLTKVTNILQELRLYNKAEKRRKLDLLSAKHDAASLRENKYKRFNNGYVAGTNDYAPEFTDDVMAYQLKNLLMGKYGKLTNEIKLFLATPFCYNQLPLFGYFMLKSGKKISFEDFYQKYLIPRLTLIEDPKDYSKEYTKVLEEYTKPFCDIEYLHSCEMVNQEYQKRENTIESWMNLPFLQKDAKDDFMQLYSMEELSYMKWVIQICNNEPDALEFFEVPEVLVGYKMQGDYKPHHYKALTLLLSAAERLNHEPVFNPNNTNFTNKISNNGSFKKLTEKMEESRDVPPALDPPLFGLARYNIKDIKINLEKKYNKELFTKIDFKEFKGMK